MSLFRKLIVCSKKSSTKRCDTECAVCQDFAKDPCTVPCGNNHVFCLACLKGVVLHRSQRNHFPCPLCRKRIRIPPGGVAVFQNDMTTRTRILTRARGLNCLRRHSGSSLSDFSVESLWQIDVISANNDTLPRLPSMLDAAVLRQLFGTGLADSDTFSLRQRSDSLGSPASFDSPSSSPEALPSGPNIESMFNFEGLGSIDIQQQIEILEQFRIQHQMDREREDERTMEAEEITAHGEEEEAEGGSTTDEDTSSVQHASTTAVYSLSQCDHSEESLAADFLNNIDTKSPLKPSDSMSEPEMLRGAEVESSHYSGTEPLACLQLSDLFDAYLPSLGGSDELDMSVVMNLIQDMEENERRERKGLPASSSVGTCKAPPPPLLPLQFPSTSSSLSSPNPESEASLAYKSLITVGAASMMRRQNSDAADQPPSPPLSTFLSTSASRSLESSCSIPPFRTALVQQPLASPPPASLSSSSPSPPASYTASPLTTSQPPRPHDPPPYILSQSRPSQINPQPQPTTVTIAMKPTLVTKPTIAIKPTIATKPTSTTNTITITKPAIPTSKPTITSNPSSRSRSMHAERPKSPSSAAFEEVSQRTDTRRADSDRRGSCPERGPGDWRGRSPARQYRIPRPRVDYEVPAADHGRAMPARQDSYHRGKGRSTLV